MSLVEAALTLLFGAPSPQRQPQATTSQEWPGHNQAMANGWREWLPPYLSSFEPSPYDYPRVWIWRLDWRMPIEAEPTKLDSMMNVVGLYWKPWAPSTPAIETRKAA